MAASSSDINRVWMTADKPIMLQFKRLCCGADIIWGINTKDEVYALATVPSSITNESGALEWKLVDDFTSTDTKLTDVSTK